ncbi:MAG TPA: 4Fe-4S ferredoxin [Syntrophomonas sp.]|nr:4Fe-4S ferredoxin [Syntrophomonas sp.]HCF70260.1 4Fe-4S ferredoxin [Syntrophomonas sp.]
MASWKRRCVQIAATITSNSYFNGFVEGSIYRGNLKKVCIPGLNCYSCPGALGSCPIGSLQAVIGSINYNLSLYVLGFLILAGTLMGRLVCGWLCPFGFIQELLHKIPSPKIKFGAKATQLKYLKYIVLAGFVVILPAFVVNEAGIGAPAFCKYICPAGTLEGGLPLVLLNESLRSALGPLFVWKLALLVLTIAFSIIIFRPFCRFICPLGAVYALFNAVSLYRFEIDAGKCTGCGECSRTCPMGVKVCENPNDPECIRCGDCIEHCPQNAISSHYVLMERSVLSPEITKHNE